jgi:hypothetical protein
MPASHFGKGVGARPRANSTIDPVVNHLYVSRDGAILWNGSRVDAGVLAQYFALTQTMYPTPYLVVRIEPGTNPALVARARNSIHRGAECPPTSVWSGP